MPYVIVSANGTALSGEGIEIARRVGVRDAARIRLCIVDRVPMPADPMLAEAAREVGFTSQATAGLTLGFVVFVRRGLENDVRLLSHELRHVAQYEACGGIAPFLSAHLPQLVQFGYEDAPFEVDARAHEISP